MLLPQDSRVLFIGELGDTHLDALSIGREATAWAD